MAGWTDKLDRCGLIDCWQFWLTEGYTKVGFAPLALARVFSPSSSIYNFIDDTISWSLTPPHATRPTHSQSRSTKSPTKPQPQLTALEELPPDDDPAKDAAFLCGSFVIGLVVSLPTFYDSNRNKVPPKWKTRLNVWLGGILLWCCFSTTSPHNEGVHRFPTKMTRSYSCVAILRRILLN